MTSKNRKSSNHRNEIAEDVLDRMAVLSDYSNGTREFVVSLVDMFVDQFVMKKAMRIVERRFLKQKAEEKFGHHSRKAWQFTGHIETEQIAHEIKHPR